MARKWKPPIARPAAARPYTAIAFEDPDAYFQARKALEKQFGRFDYESPAVDGASFVSLYGPVGFSQIRFLSFVRPVGREEIVDMRKKTIAIEMEMQNAGRPIIEIDPGYVTSYSVVRTALDEDFHRIYFYDGIYVESIYFFERMSFRPWLHTPEFFRSQEVLTVFNDVRLILSNG